MTWDEIVDKHKDHFSNCYCGYSCGPGWLPLINGLSTSIEMLGIKGFEYHQIKEKFGTLRVYYNFDIGYKDSDVEDLDPEDLKNNEIKILGYIDGAIQLAERMSAVTCERCGVIGKIRQSGWVKCLCNTCNEL